METKLREVKNKNTQELLYLVKDGKSRFLEGEEYLPVFRDPNIRHQILYVKKSAIIYTW